LTLKPLYLIGELADLVSRQYSVNNGESEENSQSNQKTVQPRLPFCDSSNWYDEN